MKENKLCFYDNLLVSFSILLIKPIKVRDGEWKFLFFVNCIIRGLYLR